MSKTAARLQGCDGLVTQGSVSRHERAVLEARRYARAVAAGVAIAFVMLVAAPETPLTYPLAVGFFVAAGVLIWIDD